MSSIDSAVVFICAPYADPDEGVQSTNLYRAVQLGHLAVSLGLSPIVPHLLGRAGLYGPASDPGIDSPARTLALERCAAIAQLVAYGRGELWILTRNDGSLSKGCEVEHNAFMDAHQLRCFSSSEEVVCAKTMRLTWNEWLMRIVEAAI